VISAFVEDIRQVIFEIFMFNRRILLNMKSSFSAMILLRNLPQRKSENHNKQIAPKETFSDPPLLWFIANDEMESLHS